MTAKRVIIEIGTGNDLHGGDYTKAAVRAVQDAIHHSSLKPDPQRSASIRRRCRSRSRSACSSRTGSTPRR